MLFAPPALTSEKLVAAIASDGASRLSSDDVTLCLDIFANLVCEQIRRGGVVDVAGLGTFAPAPRGDILIFTEGRHHEHH